MSTESNKRIEVYDLDGTLSHLNNTFDFIFSYHYETKHFAVYFLYKLINKIVVYFPFVDYQYKRAFIINFLFFGVSVSKLEAFFDNQYKYYLLSRLTPLGKNLLQKDNSNNVMLTGCTEIPAQQISNIFGFGSLISTTFHISNGRIYGIVGDTYGNLKKHYIEKKEGLHMTYYSDDMVSESDLYEIMDEVVVVDYERPAH
jgi:hypothetical protein